MRERLRAAMSLATLALHLAVASRYDFFRDELYFIVCGRHPAWGYADQPPVVPLLAALSQSLGEHLFLLRAISALAAAGTTYVTMTLAKRLGAGVLGSALAGVAAATAPMYLGIMTTLATSTFEPLLWTLLADLVVRAVRDDEPAAWLWVGAVVGLDLEIKYELPIYLVPLMGWALLAGRARAFRSRHFLGGVLIAAVLAAPSALWQLRHGLPFLEMIRNQSQGGKNVALAPLSFLGLQFQVMNPLYVPIWVAGLVAPFVSHRFRPLRFLSLAFATSFLLLMLLHAKDYYVAPLYGAMFALGGAALEAWWTRRAVLLTYLGVAVVPAVVAAPMALPLLSPDRLVAYLRALHLTPQSGETQKQGVLPQSFADMFGWREMTRQMELAVQKLPPSERSDLVILAHNYGEAAAFEFYGRGLPTVVAGHNQYYFWGLRGTHPTSFLAFNREVTELKNSCAEAVEVGHFFAPWVVPFEDDSAITLCRGARPPLAQRWPSLKLFY